MLNYSITSSARPSSVSGTVMPNAFAVACRTGSRAHTPTLIAMAQLNLVL